VERANDRKLLYICMLWSGAARRPAQTTPAAAWTNVRTLCRAGQMSASAGARDKCPEARTNVRAEKRRGQMSEPEIAPDKCPDAGHLSARADRPDKCPSGKSARTNVRAVNRPRQMSHREAVRAKRPSPGQPPADAEARNRRGHLSARASGRDKCPSRKSPRTAAGTC
jgi:hypothetical protein